MYQNMFYVGLACTFIFLVVSIILFVKNDVRKRIGDLTGANARKAIKELNKNSLQELSKKEAVQPETGKIQIHSEKTGSDDHEALKEGSKKERKPRKRRKQIVEDEATELLAFDDQETDVLPSQDEATDILTDDRDTEILAEAVTESLVGEEATELLYDEVNISAGGFDSILNGASDLDVVSNNESEQTDVLSRIESDDAFADVSGDDGYTEKLSAEEMERAEESFTTVLADNTKEWASADEAILTEEILKMPEIFEVEEDVTVVHTDDSI